MDCAELWAKEKQRTKKRPRVILLPGERSFGPGPSRRQPRSKNLQELREGFPVWTLARDLDQSLRVTEEP